MRTMLLDKYGEYGAPGQTDPAGQSVRDSALARGVLGAEPPPEDDGAAAGKRELSAAGFHSIYETLRHGWRMGVTRSLKTLTRINQKEGFDCPSCAWPDPDDERNERHFKVVPYPIPRGCAAAYFPETNVLVPVRSVADGSNQPTSKSLTITVEPSTEVAGETKADLT